MPVRGSHRTGGLRALTHATGFDAKLEGGPFHGRVLAVRSTVVLEQPPAEVDVYLCSCCNQVVAFPHADARGVVMREVGLEPVTYERGPDGDYMVRR